MRKPVFCICDNKGADLLRGYRSAFVFATYIVQKFYFLNLRFQALTIVACFESDNQFIKWYKTIAYMLRH